MGNYKMSIATFPISQAISLCTLHWLPVEFRIHFKIIIITFKAIHGQAPLYLQENSLTKGRKRVTI